MMKRYVIMSLATTALLVAIIGPTAVIGVAGAAQHSIAAWFATVPTNAQQADIVRQAIGKLEAEIRQDIEVVQSLEGEYNNARREQDDAAARISSLESQVGGIRDLLAENRATYEFGGIDQPRSVVEGKLARLASKLEIERTVANQRASHVKSMKATIEVAKNKLAQLKIEQQEARQKVELCRARIEAAELTKKLSLAQDSARRVIEESGSEFGAAFAEYERRAREAEGRAQIANPDDGVLTDAEQLQLAGIQAMRR